jgi:hypothetical protein
VEYQTTEIACDAGSQVFAMNAYGFQRIRLGLRYQEAIAHARGQMIGDLTRG